MRYCREGPELRAWHRESCHQHGWWQWYLRCSLLQGGQVSLRQGTGFEKLL